MSNALTVRKQLNRFGKPEGEISLGDGVFAAIEIRRGVKGLRVFFPLAFPIKHQQKLLTLAWKRLGQDLGDSEFPRYKTIAKEIFTPPLPVHLTKTQKAKILKALTGDLAEAKTVTESRTARLGKRGPSLPYQAALQQRRRWVRTRFVKLRSLGGRAFIRTDALGQIQKELLTKRFGPLPGERISSDTISSWASRRNP